jgi:hypothetical protein
MIDEADRDAKNLSTPGKIYIYNYLYVPPARLDLISHLRGEDIGIFVSFE